MYLCMLSFFSGVKEVVKEKSYLVKALKDGGVFVVNGDDKRAFEMKTFAKDKKYLRMDLQRAQVLSRQMKA